MSVLSNNVNLLVHPARGCPPVYLEQATQKAEDRMKITEDLVKEREMIISSLEAELTSYKNEVNGLAWPCLALPGVLTANPWRGLGSRVFVPQHVAQKNGLFFGADLTLQRGRVPVRPAIFMGGAVACCTPKCLARTKHLDDISNTNALTNDTLNKGVHFSCGRCHGNERTCSGWNRRGRSWGAS